MAHPHYKVSAGPYKQKTSFEQRIFPLLVSDVIVAQVIATGFVASALATGRDHYIASAKEFPKTIADLLQANLLARTHDIDLALR